MTFKPVLKTQIMMTVKEKGKKKKNWHSRATSTYPGSGLIWWSYKYRSGAVTARDEHVESRRSQPNKQKIKS